MRNDPQRSHEKEQRTLPWESEVVVCCCVAGVGAWPSEPSNMCHSPGGHTERERERRCNYYYYSL